jgi:hypothetical protein
MSTNSIMFVIQNAIVQAKKILPVVDSKKAVWIDSEEVTEEL